MKEQTLHYSDAPDVSYDTAPEMAPYLAQPDAMYVGCPGKRGYLNLEFALDPDRTDGRSILTDLDRRAPLIVQQELYFDEELSQMPCVYILASGGPNVDGDRFTQNFTLRKGSMAFVSTGAATKIAVMKRNYSAMNQRINVEDGAYFEYLPEPIIPCRNSRFISDTQMTVAPTATCVYSEIYMSGRKYYAGGERFVYDVLSVKVTGRHEEDGEPLFSEKMLVTPGQNDVEILGVMGGFDVFANVVVMTPPEVAEKVFEQTDAFFDAKKRLAAGITRLPGQAGVLYKVLGMEPGPVKVLVRELCSRVRMQVKGVPVPPEFPWR